jgi:hypothetical protein
LVIQSSGIPYRRYTDRRSRYCSIDPASWTQRAAMKRRSITRLLSINL